MPMPMDMPAGMVMDGAGAPGSPDGVPDGDPHGVPDRHPGHADHGTCHYGSAPAHGALPTDNSLTFGGFQYNNPRQIIGRARYRFGY